MPEYSEIRMLRVGRYALTKADLSVSLKVQIRKGSIMEELTAVDISFFFTSRCCLSVLVEKIFGSCGFPFDMGA